LKKAGYDVSFAFAYVDEKLREERLAEFPVIEYSKFIIKDETLKICSSLISDGKMESFKGTDLVICHSFPSSYFALRMQNKLKIPYILHLHHPPQFLYTADASWANNSFKRKFSYTFGKILRPLLRRFDKYCVTSAKDYLIECESVNRIIKEIYGISSGTVTYPPFDPVFKIVKCSMKDLEKFGITKKYILGSGRIIKQKRFDYLVEAFSNLKNKDLQLVIAGKYSEEMKKELDDLANKKGVKLLFLGSLNIEDLVRVYNLASVTVLTCPKEWFGLVPIEAMACGCPVVAWKDNFGPEESISEGIGGFLAKPYDTEDLTRKISLALSKKWNREAIRKSVSKFSEDAVAKKLINKIDQIV
ncbi:MAG: glycosyltransferase family 4 protein, partial [archaeon]